MEELKEMHRGSISVCMIARDEEEHIAEALMSVKDLVDEMIVVDTGSKDATILEAKRLGARVYEIPWNNDFSEARNFALSKATREWILVIDADELISRDDHEKIRALVRETESAAFIFEQCTYTNALCGPGLRTHSDRDGASTGFAACFSDRQIRLFRGGAGVRYACEIHENVEESLMLADIPVRESGLVIHHYGRIAQSDRVYRKAAAWCALAREGVGACPGASMYLYEMAVQLLELGRADGALAHAEVALDLDPQRWEFWNIAGLAHLRSGGKEKAISCFRDGLRAAGETHAELSNNMGVALMENGESAEALLHFERALELDGDNADVLRNAASACALVGEFDRGLEYIARSLSMDPFAAHSHAIHADIRYRLNDCSSAARILETMRFLPDTPFKVYLKVIQLYTRMHLIDEAAEVVRRAMEEFPERVDLRYLAGKIAELHGDDDRAIVLYRRALAADPGHADALSSLGCIHERRSNLDDALAAFREALRLKPHDAELEVNVGIVLDKLGRIEEAGRHFENVMGNEEESGFACNA
ncbi:MAG: tetratricopeptide repeat protein, partial [Candidatus Krumholzibacteria bacterium]|nr:tetratricopeptide repeat protein [Candidatus Krumholzibacteria bacterium]